MTTCIIDVVRCYWSLALLVLGACATGTRSAVVVGPMFSEPGAGVAISLEVSGLIYDEPGWTRAGTGRARLSRSVGLAATAATTGLWQAETGFSGSLAAGLDLLPILHTHAHGRGIAPNLVVGFGGHVGYGVGEDGGAGVAAVPRLWFVASFWERGLVHYTLGGMFRCQFALSDELPSACGPALIATRLRLRGSVSPP